MFSSRPVSLFCRLKYFDLIDKNIKKGVLNLYFLTAQMIYIKIKTFFTLLRGFYE